MDTWSRQEKSAQNSKYSPEIPPFFERNRLSLVSRAIAVLNGDVSVAEHSQWLRFWKLKVLLEKTQLLCVYLAVIYMTSETYAKSHGQSPLSERWSLPLPGIYYYVFKTKLQTSCRDIVTVAWTLLTAVHAGMLLTHTPMHFFFHCCIQFPTKADSPTGLEGLCHEFYSSSNAEQH